MSEIDDKDWSKRHASVQEVINENADLRAKFMAVPLMSATEAAATIPAVQEYLTAMESRLVRTQDCLVHERTRVQQLIDRAETAEAKLAAATKRIEEAEKQEPTAYIYPAAYGSRASLCKENKPVDWDDDDCQWYEQPLYTFPTPPADVAELQQQATDWRKKYEKEFARRNAWIKDYGEACQQLNGRIAELERKLAEQHAILVNISNGLQEIQEAEYGEDADEAAAKEGGE